MAENGLTDLKVQIEGVKKDVENVNNLNTRLDTAIEKLTDVSTSIKSMFGSLKPTIIALATESWLAYKVLTL